MADTGRSSAYAELLQALIAVRADPATARFDAELARAEADGRIDGPTARALRWWQRETLRGLVDHLTDVLPEVLDRLAAADDAAREAVHGSEQSWEDATRSLPALASGDDVAPGPGHAPPSAPLAPAPAPGPERTEGGGGHLRPVDPLDTLGGGSTTAADGGGLTPPRVLRPGFTPPESAPEAHQPAAPGAPRTRLIAGGLTVAADVRLGRGAGPSTPTDPYGLAR